MLIGRAPKSSLAAGLIVDPKYLTEQRKQLRKIGKEREAAREKAGGKKVDGKKLLRRKRAASPSNADI